MPDSISDVLFDAIGGNAPLSGWDFGFTIPPWGSLPVPPPATTPRLIVRMAFGTDATADDTGPGFFRLGTSVLGGPDILGTVYWVDVSADVRSVSTDPGQTSPLESISPSTASIVVDNFSGDYDPVNIAGPYAIDVGQQVWVQAVDDSGTLYNLWRGYIDDVVPDYGTDPAVTFTCSDGLATLGRVKISATAPVYDADRTGTRIGRILDAALWPTSLRSLAAGYSTVQAETFGDYALALVARVADTEIGAVFVDGTGKIVFYDRLQTYVGPRSTSVQATFSDTGTDIDMTQLPAQERRSEIANEVRVTRNGGVEQVATDAASRLKYGVQTFPGSVGTMAASDVDAASIASWIVARFKTPALRLPQIMVDATAQGMWSQLLALRRYDRVQVNRDYGPVALSRQALVEGIGHDIVAGGTWTMTFTVRDAQAFTPFILGRSTLGGGDRLV